jgi:hypothetical protein
MAEEEIRVQLESLKISPSSTEKETKDGPVLFDLLLDYYNKNTGDECERIKHVLNALYTLRVSHQEQVDEILLASEKEGKTLPYVVVWYDSPCELWQERTYATFMVSFFHSFFNPVVNLCDIGTYFDGVTKEAELQIRSQFGAVLQFLHRESPFLKAFLLKLLDGSEEKVSEMLNSELTKPIDAYKMIKDVWLQAAIRCNTMRISEYESVINECIIRYNVELFSKGLKIPTLLAEILLHDYNTKKSYITKCIDYEEDAKHAKLQKEETTDAVITDVTGQI